MFECPNCGGNLRFDIPSQQLACDFCHTFHDPYAVTKDHDAVEQDMYDVTVFTCPQCGGELMSTENSAAEFAPSAALPRSYPAGSAKKNDQTTSSHSKKQRMTAKTHTRNS